MSMPPMAFSTADASEIPLTTNGMLFFHLETDEVPIFSDFPEFFHP